MWVTGNHTDIYIMGGPEGEERWKEAERYIWRNTAEIFPNLYKKKNTNLHILELTEVQIDWIQRDPHMFTCVMNKHIIVKVLNVKRKEKILKAASEKLHPT